MRDFQLPGRSLSIAEKGMAATSHPLAAATAIDILKAGGNAMDAAIAGAVLLGFCEPQSTGIGGDLFALWNPGGSDEVLGLNGSGRAPQTTSASALRDQGRTNIARTSPEAVTVPGAIDAFCRLSADWGRLGIDRLLAPSIDYAQAGVPVAPRVAFDWTLRRGNLHGRAEAFYLKDGQPLGLGDKFHAPEQAEVLRRIAREGRDGFYSGEVAQDMVDSLSKAGGVHQLSDFAASRPDLTTPVSGTYRSAEVLEHPPNGQGIVAHLILGILDQFDLTGLVPFGAQRAHLEAEAAKLAMGLRDRLVADPDHDAGLKVMLAADTARKLAGQIDPKCAGPFPAQPRGRPHKDTVYITVVDQDRMAVSLIYSTFDAFGSGIASDKFGILFHSRGSGFSLEEGHPNEIGRGKRPLHTIIPGMVRRGGRVAMPFGVMGGHFQPTGHARFITNIEDFGMDIQTAISSPRAFATQGRLAVERGYSDQVRAELADMGHDVFIPPAPLGGAQAIEIDHDKGVLLGASDPRKDSCALGY